MSPRSKSKPAKQPIPKHFHIDKRAETILDASKNVDDDDLLSTKQLAVWLGVSVQFLETGQILGLRPPSSSMLSARRIGYLRSAVRTWLQERTFACTSEYSERPAPPKRARGKEGTR